MRMQPVRMAAANKGNEEPYSKEHEGDRRDQIVVSIGLDETQKHVWRGMTEHAGSSETTVLRTTGTTKLPRNSMRTDHCQGTSKQHVPF